MTGANCYSQDYSFLEQQLAGRGYLVAIIDELHPVTPDTQAFISRTHLLGTQRTVSNACPSCCAMCCQSGSSARPFCQRIGKLLQHSSGMDTCPGTMTMHMARLLVINHAPTTVIVL